MKRYYEFLFPRLAHGIILDLSPQPLAHVFQPSRQETIHFEPGPGGANKLFCNGCSLRDNPCRGGNYVIQKGDCAKGYTPADLERQSITREIPGILWTEKPTLREPYKIRCWREESGEIQTAHFSLGNVYSDSLICWGRVEKPPTLRSAAAQFFQAPFNLDLTVTSLSLLDYLQQWVPTDWRPWSLPEFHVARSSPCDSAVICDTATFLKKVPPEYHWKTSSRPIPFGVAWVHQRAKDNVVTFVSPSGGPGLVTLKDAVKNQKTTILGTTQEFPNFA